jgi:hypothetical protein
MYSDKMSTLQWNKPWVVVAGVVTVFLLYTFFTIDSSSKTFATEWPQETEKEHNQEYLLWPSFKINAAHDEVIKTVT